MKDSKSMTDISLEMSVIGVLISEPNSKESFKILNILKDNSYVFSCDKNIEIFDSIISITQKIENLNDCLNIDLLTVIHELRCRGTLDAITPNYVVDCINKVNSSKNSLHHTFILVELYFRRCIYALGTLLQHRSTNYNKDIFIIIDEFQDQLNKADVLLNSIKAKML